MPRAARATTSAAILRIGLASPPPEDSPLGTTVSGAAVETDFGVDASGFRWSWTVACGMTFDAEAGCWTFAVSFFVSETIGAGATGPADGAGVVGF